MARFKTRARTVDLLGRQQIAGIPTAIHELFKNAHDAYADHVQVDYFRDDRLFVLRDDGVGMTREEFENRWLVVGTESKVANQHTAAPPIDLDKPRRPVLGEKGIGRLAIGIVGDMLLVLTRAARGDEPHPLVAALLHWDLFALPGVDLDEIDVPLVTVEDGESVSSETVAELLSQLESCVQRLESSGDLASDRLADVRRDIVRWRQVRFDPWEQERYLGGAASLNLRDGHRGTQFWVLPADEVIDADLDGSKDSASPIERVLLGFSNQMTPGAEAPVLSVAFRVHVGGREPADIVSKEAFFTPTEFRNADHYVSGQCDEYGNFRGIVSIYGEETEHTIRAQDRELQETACGPFEFHLAYVQGAQRESTLPDEEWLAFNAKSARLGGVYVYLDGIRILPYGDPSNDWLHIEERRTRGAGYYFFSHRRMCGAVLLSRQNNPSLVEKAGREGFIANTSFRQLRSVLEYVLIQLAADFFRKDALISDRHDKERKRLDQLAKAREARNTQASARKVAFMAALENLHGLVEQQRPQQELSSLEQRTESELEAILELPPTEQAARAVLLHSSATTALESLRGRYRLARPRVNLSKSQDRSWRIYEKTYVELESHYFFPTERRLLQMLNDVIEAASLQVSVRERLAATVKPHLDQGESDLKSAHDSVRDALADAEAKWRPWYKNQYREQLGLVREIGARLPELAVSLADNDALVATARQIAVQVKRVTDDYCAPAARLTEQLRALSIDQRMDPLEQVAAFEQEAEDLREQLEEELEAAQLGKAIAVISHEFQHHIVDLRDSVRTVSKWGDQNPRLRPVTQQLRLSFEHLDGYMTLFTPLQRRLYRSTTVIRGGDMYAYLERLFRHRLKERHTTLEATRAFLEFSFVGFPSTYFPVFVNLVDNATFWLADQHERRITLDATDDTLIVRDTGPGIHEVDREDVFKRGFSRKPAGLGLGLAIARDAMARLGGSLYLGSPPSGAELRLRLPHDSLQDDAKSAGEA